MLLIMDTPNEAIKVQTVSEEKFIHSELVSLFLETSESGFVDFSVWSRVNELLQQLSTKNSRYLAYRLNSGNAAHSIPVMRFKQQLRSAIDVLAVQEKLEDLSHIIRRNFLSSSMTFQNMATSNPTQINNQEVKISMEQRVNLVIKEIEDNLSDEQLKSVRPLIEEYKKKPTKNASEKLVGGILGLGKDIAIGVIANIISKQLGA
ncbi:MAG: hypothetical protein ACD_12C00776G0002 [uncultured bacterium]|nr:MAG: hypothetical protein ACD_12C00776G0002 [uncultured bacterium]